MKIVSYNINGIRAANKLGIIEWIKSFDAEIYCFQEVRCNELLTKEIIEGNKSQISIFDNNTTNILSNYYAIYNCGEIAGYAGTLILTKLKPDNIAYDMGNLWTDKEGRTTTIFINDTAIINAYIPNGNSRLEFKMQYLNALNLYITKLKEKFNIICVGDFNIAHNEIDLTNPKECKNKSVFLPIEREALTNLLNLGLTDTFRYLNPDKKEYSWRSYRSRIDNNYKSWKYRIDYILTSNNLNSKLETSDILDLPYSDHLACTAKIKI